MRTFKVKPISKGLLVRDPETRQPLKAAGEVKPRNTYWLRRIKDKSVVEVKAKQQKQETEE
ncbi:DUF2635 domain-containing protein [Vibrio sp. St2]|uniref:DUF2635 domain-containing protein n=1 Tax=Vibrio sp. St2 TaxID=2853441 RepID=UPI00248DE73B|nr:DUF2635 domain-containing protein [Vibrio sp. St2]